MHKTRGRALEIGALLIRRKHRDSDTVLLTTGLALGMEGADLADLYDRRWPVQENAFKEGAAVGLAEHRGNGGRIVANVAVVTELERLEARAARDGEALHELIAKEPTLEAAASERATAQRRANAALVTRRQRLDALIAEGLSVRGRKETSPDHELVVFYENPRDPAVNDVLRDACDRLNRRKLERDDRRLAFAVQPQPARFD